MFKFDYKYAILLDKLINGEDFIFFLNFDILYSGGGVNHPFRRAFSCFTVVCHCKHVMYQFKAKYAE